jgi:hypothetical protein
MGFGSASGFYGDARQLARQSGTDLSSSCAKIVLMTVTISICAGPSGGTSMASEISLLKPALLYADHVNLSSPVATMLHTVTQVAESAVTSTDTFAEVIAILEPATGEKMRAEIASSPRRRVQLDRTAAGSRTYAPYRRRCGADS